MWFVCGSGSGVHNYLTSKPPQEIRHSSLWCCVSKSMWCENLFCCLFSRLEGIFNCVCCRCEDMVDVRRLKMLQMVQLFKCEEDALQVRNATQNATKHTHICGFHVFMLWLICACIWLGSGVAQWVVGRLVEDSRQTGRRLSGDQDHAGQTQEVCGCRSGEMLHLIFS